MRSSYKIERVALFTKRRPCFLCSRSLQYKPTIKAYLGFMINVDGIEQAAHRACAEEDLEEVLNEMAARGEIEP